MALGRIKLPHMPELSVRSGRDFENSPSMMRYDEVIYDYKTDRYLTLSQQEEICRLKKELDEKKQKRDADVKKIIGYFYKAR